jgi:biotin carboxyl carrier protein
VRAPSLGTFYSAPKPGAPKFADVGAQVEAQSELCLIEVMKLFTTMRAGIAGVVREIHVKDGDLVEFDQPLFLIEPNA